MKTNNLAAEIEARINSFMDTEHPSMKSYEGREIYRELVIWLKDNIGRLVKAN